MVTIDASVLVAAALPGEAAHPESLAVLGRADRNAVPIDEPALALVEVAAAIGRRTGDAGLAEQGLRVLLRLPGATFHALDAPTAVLAAGVAGHLRLRAGDAAYVAVAHERRGTLVTLDEELLRRAAPLVDACTPAEWLARDRPVDRPTDEGGGRG